MEAVSLSCVPKLIDATTEVFEKMVFTTLGVREPLVNHPQPPANVMGAVRFLGTINGTVSFYASQAAACRIAGKLLGISPDEASSHVPDAVGEITNMIAGRFRAKMVQVGESLAITTPTVTSGTDFSAQHFGVVVTSLCPLTMGDSQVFVELALQVV